MNQINKKKVITFCLYGNIPRYTIGAIRNAELAQYIYPDFECWFYIHEETVHPEIINILKNMNNVKIIIKNGDLSKCKPRMWRFEAIDEPDVELMMSRDTDTRFWDREKLAVDEWLKSDKIFHIMRDHPHHNFYILAGMFGVKKTENIPSWSKLMNNIIQENGDNYDQDFLKNFIYPLIKSESIVHASFHKIENEDCLDFPIPFNEYLNFVGEYVYEDESRSEYHINELRMALS